MTIRNKVSRRVARRLFDGYSKCIFYREGNDNTHTYDGTNVVAEDIIQYLKRKTPSP